MAKTIIHDFATITAQVIGELDVVNQEALPSPWFCKDIFRKKDLQWAGYIGPFSLQKQALVFGINLEFTAAWRRVYKKLEGDFVYFSELLRKHKNFEWHWMGRPGIIAKNPTIKWLSKPMWTFQVDLNQWIVELESILSRKEMWSLTVPMRPQIQVMRFIGLPNQLPDISLIKQNIHQTTQDLRSLVDFIGR